MLNKIKVKSAARRVKRTKRRNTNRFVAFWLRVWDFICAVCATIWEWLGRVWAWICGINVIGLVNTVLLCGIIVLFSMLIMDIVAPRNTVVVAVNNKDTTTAIADKPHGGYNCPTTKKETILPMKRDAETGKYDAPVANVVPAKPDLTQTQVAKDTSSRIMYGDLVIDNRDAAAVLHNGARIHGNVFLQNMRKYTLPCNIEIHGNLFLRDLGLLQFCGDFKITGNIYVNPRSSMGPVPGTARLGGQVII